jgi:hypothetical protein
MFSFWVFPIAKQGLILTARQKTDGKRERIVGLIIPFSFETILYKCTPFCFVPFAKKMKKSGRYRVGPFPKMIG